MYGTLILRRHARFGTQAFDLGIFDQGLWLLSQFETPFVTIRGLHLFADHSSYVLVLLAPLYWIWSDVRVLLVLTVVAFAAGGPLVYAIARTEGVRKPLAAALAVALLLHPAVGWNIRNVFHPEVIAVPLLLAAYLLTARGRPGWGVLMLGLTLLVKEDAALIVVPLALYMAWRFGYWRICGAAAALGLAVFVFNFLVALPGFSPTGELIYTHRYAEFGDSVPTVIWGVATSPDRVLSILGTTDQLAYVAAMVGPLFLALLAPELLVVGLPMAMANLLSQHGDQASIKHHYTCYLLAVLALGAARGAARIKPAPETAPAKFIVAAVLVGGVVFAGGLGNVLAGPWPMNYLSNPWDGYSAQPDEVRAALGLIPDDAVVSADWFISPHLTHRESVYMFPNPFVRDYWAVPTEPPRPSADTVEWVVIRTTTPSKSGTGSSGTAARALALIQADAQFEEVVANEWVLVFQRVPEGRQPDHTSSMRRNSSHRINRSTNWTGRFARR